MRPPAPTKPRILIVDDEPVLLGRLEQALAGRRDCWDLQFFGSGDDALASLGAGAADVVLSDLRMPGMSGLQLLGELARRSPATVRIALSEPGDREGCLRCADMAHQVLPKPCDPDRLLSTLNRALTVDKMICNPRLTSLVAQLRSIPSLPQVFKELQDLLASPDATIEAVGQTIARDPAMTAKLLKLVNSAFFGLNRKVASPADAASLLGLETIKMLVLWAHVFSTEAGPQVPGFSLEALSAHSLSVARLAKRIVEFEHGPVKMRELALTAGLLHDLGKLVIAVNYPDLFTESLSRAHREELPFHVAERQLFGTDHAEVGAHLLGLWGLPPELVEVVAFHHRPGLCPGDRFGALTAIHAAEVFHRENEPLPGPPTAFDRDYFEALGLGAQLERWRGEFSEGGRERTR